MNLIQFPRWKFVAAILALAVALPLFASKRRSVGVPSNNPLAVKVSGTVFDAVTNRPVAFAQVRVGGRSDTADRQGRYNLSTTIYGSGTAVAERSGYTSATQAIQTAGDHIINFTLQPTPTVRLRKNDGVSHDIDFESAEFGYVPPFGSYIKAESEDFCAADGTKVTLHRSEIKRIDGPAVKESASACCGTKEGARVTVERKSGQTGILYFSDSCDFSVDFIGRDHVTGDFVYTKFSDVDEIVFP